MEQKVPGLITGILRCLTDTFKCLGRHLWGKSVIQSSLRQFHLKDSEETQHLWDSALWSEKFTVSVAFESWSHYTALNKLISSASAPLSAVWITYCLLLYMNLLGYFKCITALLVIVTQSAKPATFYVIVCQIKHLVTGNMHWVSESVFLRKHKKLLWQCGQREFFLIF